MPSIRTTSLLVILAATTADWTHLGNDKCMCDVHDHFSHFTTCKITTGAHPHIEVRHTQHKGCHPLARDYNQCVHDNDIADAKSKCAVLDHKTNPVCEVSTPTLRRP